MLCCNPCNIGCISHLLLHAELFVNALRWRMIAFPVIPAGLFIVCTAITLNY